METVGGHCAGRDHGVMADEQPEREGLQARRARQYAVRTYALDYDRATDGAEGLFDQALTNGLAAIVAQEWPGEEVERGGRMLAAARLLDVVEEHGKHKEDGVVAILRPGEPEYTQYPFEDEPMPNYTTVNVPVLRDALSATQAIRHARDSDEPTDTVLTDAHIAALRDLDLHPALYALSDEVINRAEAGVMERDRIEQNRALDYWHSLGDDERRRREMIDYEASTPGRRGTRGVRSRTALFAGSGHSSQRSSMGNSTRSASAGASRAVMSAPVTWRTTLRRQNLSVAP